MSYTPALGTPPVDLNPNNVVPAGNGFINQQEAQTLYDRPIPERTAVFERHMRYVGFEAWLTMMGFMDGTDKPTVGHYENPWQDDLIKVGAIVDAGTGAGTDMIIGLDADNMFDSGVESGGSAVKASYPRVGDVIELHDRTQVQVTAKDVSNDPHRLTITPLDSTVDLNGLVTVGDEYGILYTLHAEGDGLPNGRAPRITKYSNSFAIIKEGFGSTGSELTNAVYFETIPGDEGSAGDSIMARIKMDSIRAFERQKSNLLLFGQTADNVTKLVSETNIDTPIVGTEGFVDFALNNGISQGYTVGSYSLDDLDAAADAYYDERSAATADLLAMDGPDIAKETENAFTNTVQQNLYAYFDRIADTNQDWHGGYQEDIDDKPSQMTLGFGYKAIEKNGFIFHMKRLAEFNDVKGVGGADYNYRKYRLLVPYGWNTDALNGNSRPTIGYEVKEKNGYLRHNMFGHFAGAGVGGNNSPFGQAVNENDTIKYFLISELAGHFSCGNAVVTQIPE